MDRSTPQDLRRRTEIIPVKDPHTRIKPLALVIVFFKTGTICVKYRKADPLTPQDLRRRTGIIRYVPVKGTHTRKKPLALASGHGRYITVTPERALLSVWECPLHIAVISCSRFTSETVS
jgi:hypothetical protein